MIQQNCSIICYALEIPIQVVINNFAGCIDRLAAVSKIPGSAP